MDHHELILEQLETLNRKIDKLSADMLILQHSIQADIDRLTSIIPPTKSPQVQTPSLDDDPMTRFANPIKIDL